MPSSTKLYILTAVLLIYIAFTGCSNERRANPLQAEDNKEQNTGGQIPQTKINEEVLLDAPIISQKPELKCGCEVTSLAMLLQYGGVKVDKMTLAHQIKKDGTPLVLDKNGGIEEWGNPNDGFVGDITGKDRGFAVYSKPLIELMEKHLPGRAVNLTNQPFESLLEFISQKRPVVVWVTTNFRNPQKYEEWQKNGTKIKAALNEHAVLLVGYDRNYCYVNNPLNGMKNQKVNKEAFKKVWETMGRMAVSYK